MMEKSQNPYAAPLATDAPVSTAQSPIPPGLGVPSAVLLILGSLWSLLGVFGTAVMAAVWILFVLKFGWPDDQRAPLEGLGLVDVAIAALITIANGFIAYGAWMMRRQRRYRISMAAAILASIPYASPFGVFGIPFGIWALIVLWRPQVRAAFADAMARL